MIITLPRNINIDIDNVPDNLEEIVSAAFTEYTEGTRDEYTFEDKLCFIDDISKRLHHTDSDHVQNLIMSRFKHELQDQGRIMEPDEFYGDMAFFEDCYNLGVQDCRFYSHDYTDDRKSNEKIMRIIVRAITAVMNWEPAGAQDGKAGAK